MGAKYPYRQKWEDDMIRNGKFENKCKVKYKYKLNMLEPGTIMCKAMMILFIAGILFQLLQIRVFSGIMLAAAGVLFISLLLLLAVEQHQDHQMYLEAKRNDPDIK